MRFSQTIALIILASPLLVGFLAPETHAIEDGNFPVFPTVIENDSFGVPTPPAPVIETQELEVERSDGRGESRAAVNRLRVFSPWQFFKSQLAKTVFGEESGVSLILESLSSKPDRRGDLHYLITYKNNTNETLRGVSIQVSLSKNLQYLDSDMKPDSKTNNVVIFDIDKVVAGEKGVIQLETRLRNQKGIKAVVVPAKMEYEDIDGNKYTVIAATNNAFDGRGDGLAASALDGVGGFIVWLIVIILLVALAFVGYKYITLRASGRRA